MGLPSSGRHRHGDARYAGSFWLGHGILDLLVVAAALALPTGKFPELGFWFLALAAITLAGAIAALFESLGLRGAGTAGDRQGQ